MRISVIAVGTRMPKWVDQGVTEYAKRLPRELKLKWLEIPIEKRSSATNAAVCCEREGEKILKLIPKGDRVIALDVTGKRISTEKLAEELSDWQMSGDNYSLLIGGPDGLSAACIARADKRWSLSDLTMPHPLVRVLLAEQLYRAWTITAKHPYHRQ
jgi:23S rRNA (pseudouridine1915-N3)-methyltransferase